MAQTIPTLPTKGSTDWYSHYSALDAVSRRSMQALTPQQFGAKGDGSTDDTAAFQAFFDAVFAGLSMYDPNNIAADINNFSHFGFIPDGVYIISDSIKIKKQFVGARIEGASMAGTVIQQQTDGKSIFEFQRCLSHSFEIGHLRFVYKNKQTSPNGAYAAIFFSSADGIDTGPGYFNFHLHHLYFERGGRGISTSAAQKNTVWGAFIDHCIFGDSNTGAFIHFNNNCPGQPNISITNCYYTGTINNGTGVSRPEPVITIASCDNLLLQNNEGNAIICNNGQPELLLDNCVNTAIISCKTESCHTNGSTPIWKFTSCQVNINGAGFNGLVMENSTAATYLTWAEGELLWNSGSSTMLATGFNVGVDVPGNNFQAQSLYAVGGNCKLIMGSGSFRNNCQKYPTSGSFIPTVKADWFA